LLAADAHLAYEDVVGGALPLWSTAEIVATLAVLIARTGANELVFLGDVIHGPRMSEGAVREVRAALETLRALCTVTLVAGNHEGRARAFSVLGETVEACDRDGWLLVHGDGIARLGQRAVIGHLHPSLPLGARSTSPAFVASDALVVVPALNPYSPGLDLLSDDFARAIGLWNVRRADAHVVAVGTEVCYPFGTLATLRDALRGNVATMPRPVRSWKRRRVLRPDR
jgi:metallophosphoesterase superfamily enzyme